MGLSYIQMTAIDDLARECYNNSAAHGFHGAGQDSIPTKLLLIHTEVTEACEADRAHNPPSERVVGICSLGEELADIVIRVFDLAQQEGISISTALDAKMHYNESRDINRHGGKKY